MFGFICSLLLCVLFVIVFVLGCALPSPVVDRPRREVIGDDVQSYLMKFGYMRTAVDGVGALRTEDSVRRAIMELQRFGGLPETGHVDEKTAKLMKSPRCGLPDIVPSSQSRGRRKRRFTVQGQKWMYSNLTWSLRSKNLRNLNSYEVRHVITKALEVWSKHSKLTFTEVDSDRADILVYFHRGDHGDNFPFDGKGQVLAHAFFPGAARGGDAHFDEEEIWITREDDNNSEGTSLFHVAAHEFGHSLGLSHSPVEGALMYPWYQGMQNGFDYELPEDDRLGIQHLYGANEDRQWDPIKPYQPPTTTTSTTTTTTQRSRPTWSHPRFPTGRHHPHHNPYNPYPTQKPHNPKKPMHPNQKPNYPKYPNKNYPEKNYPRYPDRRYPERNPEKEYTPAPRYPGKEGPMHKSPPDTCNTNYDAVSVIRREVFIFKDTYFWRISDQGLLPGYPAEITRLWKGLPSDFDHVDAVYERPDGKIVFFIGRRFYVFQGALLQPGYPRPITDLGLPQSLERVDGAMVWGHNGKTYFYSGSMYWRFDEELMKVELDYPRDMSMWRGVGTDIDAVFQWKDGKTYFFKGKGFWKFNDLRMRVEHEEQNDSAQFWMGCSKNIGFEPDNKAPLTATSSTSGVALPTFHLITMLVVSFHLVLRLFPLIT